ncbi:MAG: glycosyltransferase family 4 protein [Prevotella sp.]|nr:glycosyltransferase family 4 protein [Prevotella sp.]
MKSLVIITNVLPWPLTSGGSQGQHSIIAELRKRFKITILFTQDGKNTLHAAHELQQLWPDVRLVPFTYFRQMLYPRFVAEKIIRAMKLKFMPKSRKFQLERALKPYGICFTRDFASFIRRNIRRANADLVEVNFYQMLPVVRLLPEGLPRVFVHHEIRFVRNDRLLRDFNLSEAESRYKDEIKRREIELLNRYDAILTLTDVDKHTLEQNGIERPVYASPLAVSTPQRPFHPVSHTASFVGSPRHQPNKEGIDWFVKEVLPKIKCPDFRLKIIGAGWGSFRDKRIETPGFVDNLAQAVEGTMMVVPILTGSGMRMKILEAAAMSVPFVTTTIGVEGLAFENEKSCLVADTPEAFAAAIDRLIDNPALAESLARNAAAVFTGNYTPRAMAGLRADIYEQIISEQTNC